MPTLDELTANGFSPAEAVAALTETGDLLEVNLPRPYELLTNHLGLEPDEAIDLLCNHEPRHPVAFWDGNGGWHWPNGSLTENAEDEEPTAEFLLEALGDLGVELHEPTDDPQVLMEILDEVGQELGQDLVLENKFFSAAQRKWYFANLGKKGGAAKGGKHPGGAGTGGGKGQKGALPPPHQNPVVAKAEKAYPPANADAVESHARHMKQGDPNSPKKGDFTEERAALHNEIIDEFTKGIPAAKGEKVFTMMGGGPASGKSSVLKSGQAKVPEGVKGDSDEIKTKLPEYNPLVKAGEAGAASYVHEESSYLVKQVAKTAFANGQNFTLDGTGNSKYSAVKRKVEEAKAAGYKAEAVYVTCSTEEAVRRNIERAKKTGRLPPEQMLRDTHKSVSLVVPQALKDGLFDKFELYDSEIQTGGKPTLVVSARGKDVTIHNQELYDRFLKKGEE